MRKFFNTPHPFGILLPGAEAPANPPFANWYPHPEAGSYRVTFRHADGSAAWETAHNFLTPPVALPQGYCTVIVEALDTAGVTLARIERQTRLDAPVMAVQFDLNVLERTPGARLFLSDADVDSMLAATGERGRWRDRLLDLATHVDENLLNRPSEPEAYPGGVWNLKHWQANNSLCIKFEDAIIAATVAWRLTGEDRYLEPAVEMLSHAVTWDPYGPTGLWENDHSTHALLHAFSVAYDTFGDALPSNLRAALRHGIIERCRDIYEFLNPVHMKELSCGMMGSPSNNHAWFVAEAMGIGGLALWDEEPEARSWVALAAQLHTGAFFPYGDPDGGWHEGIDYWSYSLFFTFQFLDALFDATGANLYQHPWLRKTTSFKVIAHPPVGGYVPFGDVKHHAPLAVDRLIAMRLASRHEDPLEWRYVDALAERSIDTLRYLPYALAWSTRGTTPEASAAAKPPRVAFYREMGWIVLNTAPFDADGQVLFAYRSGGRHPDSVGHNHADINSFILCLDGEKLLWDGGYYDSYGSPHHNLYSRLSKAHNVVLVDGAGQVMQTRGAFGRIARFETDDTGLEVEGDASHLLVYGGALDIWTRKASLQTHGALTIEDRIASGIPVRYSLLLHSVYPIVWNPGERTVTIRGERYELTGRLESEHPVDAVITTVFEQPPNARSLLLDTHDEYPDQYHLELRTADKVNEWKPRLAFTWRAR